MINFYYLALQNFFQTKCPDFKEVEWFVHQYDEDGNYHQIVDPALYIEFANIDYEEMGGGGQMADLTVRLHIMQENLGGEGRITDMAINHYDLVNKVYQAINWKDFNFSDVPITEFEALVGTENDQQLTNGWTRVNLRADHSYSNLICSVMTIKASGFDFYGTPVYQLISANLDLRKG